MASIVPGKGFAQDSTGRNPDIAYYKTIELKIDGKKGKQFKLTSNTTIEVQYLSESSTVENEYFIHKAYWEEVDKVKAVCRGRKLKESEIQELYPEKEDTFNSDMKFYWIRFPENLQPGDTVRYSYRKKHREIALIPRINIPNPDRLEKLTVIIKHPKEVKVDVVTFFPREPIPFTLESVSDKETHLTCGPVNHFEKTPYYEFNDTHGAFYLKLSWDDEVITPLSPAEFTTWYSGLFDKEPALPDTIVYALPIDLSECRKVTDTLAAIYDYVRQNVRYISDVEGIHTIVPHHALAVLLRLYGDCKDRANLVSVLARFWGIPVSMALVTYVPHVTCDAVHAGLFNHVICCYEGGEVPLFFDPTGKFFPFGTLWEGLIGQRALILNPVDPRFVRIDAPQDQPDLDILITGNIDTPTRCRTAITLQHEPMSSALWAHAELSGFELQQALSSILSDLLYRMPLDSLRIDSISPGRVYISGCADLSNFIIDSGDKKYLPQAPFVAYERTLLDREIDSYPIHFERRVMAALEIRLDAPGFEITPESIQLNSGTDPQFEASISNDDSGTIRLSYRFRRTDREILPGKKAAFIDFCRQYLKKRKDLFTIMEREP